MEYYKNHSQDSAYRYHPQCQFPLLDTSIQGVVRSKSFPNPITGWFQDGFINLFANNSNICKSTKTHKCIPWVSISSLLKHKAMLISVLVTIILILVGSCDAVPVPLSPARSSRSLSGNTGGGSNNRISVSFNQNPSMNSGPVPTSPTSTKSTLQTLHGLDSGSSLSIVSPLDILRQNLVMEILRRKQRQSKQRQMQLNKEILDRIG